MGGGAWAQSTTPIRILVGFPAGGGNAHRLLNLSVRYQMGPVALFFAGSNLADEQYRRDANNYSIVSGDVVSLGDGRRLMGGLDVQF